MDNLGSTNLQKIDIQSLDTRVPAEKRKEIDVANERFQSAFNSESGKKFKAEHIKSNEIDRSVEFIRVCRQFLESRQPDVSKIKAFLNEQKDFLFQNLTLINAPLGGGVTPFWLAVSVQEWDIVRLMLANPKVDVNAAPKEGPDALYMAVYRQQWDI